jgi:hypothetical protein
MCGFDLQTYANVKVFPSLWQTLLLISFRANVLCECLTALLYVYIALDITFEVKPWLHVMGFLHIVYNIDA